ncbi:extracellular catalytic domain type 1 short-chain-length polyhydroxyalkanoate depolymerase [Amycolatopsis sp. H20-H5]|uniref:extracellular catalytic domain type 1 short-chain-length polyhydroxyalkanoate depolymerase n=1 Tax=Amycolatopsis sp. H20-H5 TaxID=3046309 RepID=UPI002DBB08DE|nr:PHB depolymerase family esterase [Amycolatopsis sp. H20-H5]MEC3974997.1 PHB depolymerase family esterase [Amycolatopsis sp. H20-H5]
MTRRVHALARLTAALAGLVTAATLVVPATPAGSAGATDPPASALVPVGSFGPNPGALSMYTYTPSGLATGRPVVVALHGCTQTASDYYTHAGWPALADRWKFEVVFPQQSSANNSLRCFNWFSTADDTRGQGEAASIKSMVDKAVADHGSDTAKVYVTGLSAGGAMTADLLAAYPDVFAAGGIDSGLPAQCATTQIQATNCQQNKQNLTPAQWAARANAQAPGYTGPRPRVAIWQGASDYVVYPVNGTELRDQWTAVHGISPTPTSTRTLPAGTTLTSYADRTGTTKVQLYSIAGMGHGTAVDPGTGETQCGSTAAYFLQAICSSYYTGVFFGLDGGITIPPSSTTAPPTTPAGQCVTATNYVHVQAGRAHQSGGEAYANGSNQDMGLWNTWITHVLRQDAVDSWTLADGQC